MSEICVECGKNTDTKLCECGCGKYLCENCEIEHLNVWRENDAKRTSKPKYNSADKCKRRKVQRTFSRKSRKHRAYF